jgi:hypothetical protein
MLDSRSINESRLNYARKSLQVAASLFTRDDVRNLEASGNSIIHGPFVGKNPKKTFSREKNLATAFEWLARVEELVEPRRDKWGRFLFSQSGLSSGINGLLQEPPVNKCLLDMFCHDVQTTHTPPQVGQTDKWFGDKDFCVALTHDVDILKQWTPRGIGRTLKDLAVKSLRGDRNKTFAYCRAILDAPAQMIGRSRDPFFNIKEIARLEREFGFDSTFYFLFAHRHELDGAEPRTYEKCLGKALEEALAAGCEVGVHGSTLAAEEFDELIFERERCQQMTGAKEVGLRFHNLRLDVRWSFDIIERAGFVYDATLGFPDWPGWRNGFTYPYRPYNFREERVYNFIEIPLVVMDGTFFLERYRNMPVEKAKAEILKILATFKRWHGAGTICWHNHTFDPYLSMGYDKLYCKMLEWIADNNGIGVSAMRLAKEWQQRAERV